MFFTSLPYDQQVALVCFGTAGAFLALCGLCWVGVWLADMIQSRKA
jgi:hypothetical protein